MKKFLIGALIIVSIFVISVKIVNASFGAFFGGIILYTEAIEITTLEAAGYSCEMQGGSTIEIWSVMGPTSYFIPGYVVPVTNTTLSAGQQILGIYDGETSIVCTRDEDKNVTSQTMVILPNVSYFGTSES